MTDQRQSELDELTSPVVGDEQHIVDVSDTTDHAAGTSKRMTLQRIADLFKDLVQTLTNKTLTSPTINSPTISSPSGLVKGDVGLGNANNTSDATKNSATATLTNKRKTHRVTTITSHATPTINTDNCDVVSITAQAAAITSMTTNLSGTPTNFQGLIFRILDDGTGRAITWGAKFEARGTDLPTTTTSSKLLTVGFIYDTVDDIWGCVAVQEES